MEIPECGSRKKFSDGDLTTIQHSDPCHEGKDAIKRYQKSAFEIRVTTQSVSEKIHYLTALAGGNVSFADGLLRKTAETADEFLGVILDILNTSATVSPSTSWV